ncbi:MAG TPA: ROK family protein [Streptosporangiaceae bacterium]
MAQAPTVLGLDFGGTKIAAAVCDLAGRQLAATVLPSAAVLAGDGGPSAREIFDRGIQAGRDLLAEAADGAEPAAVGVVTFGIPFEDRVELAPSIGGWEKLPMGSLLRAAFPGVPIRMATDAKAAALAEVRWGALAGSDPAVYLNLGTGLAAALVVGGQVIYGHDGAAGEIGYHLRSVADVRRQIGHRTMLEQMVSGQALARRASELAGPVAARDVFADPAAAGLLGDLAGEFADELALHVVNLAITLNPQRIAVGGGMVGSWHRIGPVLDGALTAGVPFPPELVLARYPYDAPLRGAVALAVDAAARGGEPGRDHSDPHARHVHHRPAATAHRASLSKDTRA